MDVNVTLPFIQAIITAALLSLVLRHPKHNTQTRWFSLFLVSMSLWGLFIGFMRNSEPGPGGPAIYWEKAGLFMIACTSVSFYYFASSHVRTHSRLAIILPILYLLSSLALASTNLLVKDIGIDKYGNIPDYQPVFYVWAAIIYILIIASMVNLNHARKTSESYETRNRYLYYIVGATLCLAGGILDILPALGIDIYPGSIVANIGFAIVTAVGIMRVHLLDLNLVIRKSVAYLLTSTVVAIPIVGTIILVNQFVGQGQFTIWMYIVLLLLVAIGLQAVWLRIQNLVDRLFFRERYDFLRELERFGIEAHDISDIGKLGLKLVGLIGQALQTSSVQLFVVDDATNLNLIASTSKVKQEVVFQNNSPLVRWLGRTNEIIFRHQLDITPQLQSLTSREKVNLAGMGAELFVPLKTNKDELVGMIILGKKRSEQPYSGEDTRRILTVSNRVSIELENARLYARESSIRWEMQRQNEQKTEFLHHVAHELKTPLTAIISSSELITSEGLTVNPEQKERLLANINRSAWLMDKRVGELLDLARIQIGTLELKLEPVDMDEMVRDLTSQLSALFRNKEQTISIDIPDSLPKVKADKERVEEIIINILSNANKFSPARGSIAIRASTVRNKVILEVKDSASLIGDEDKIRIFNAYYRGGSAEDRQRISGLGLGLAISKSLIELHHGEIGVKNEDKQGNIFFFTLPIWGIGEEQQSDGTPALSREGG